VSYSAFANDVGNVYQLNTRIEYQERIRMSSFFCGGWVETKIRKNHISGRSIKQSCNQAIKQYSPHQKTLFLTDRRSNKPDKLEKPEEVKAPMG